MASNIDDVSINSAYPVAGQDNDSQGFRDNFGTIKSNFVASKAEIEALQDNTAKKNEANNFLGNNISNANLVDVSEELNAGGTVQASQNIDFQFGPVQTFIISGDVTLTTTGWPESGKVGKIRVILVNDGTTRTLTIGTEAGSTLKYHNDWPYSSPKNEISVTNDTNPIVIDFWTYNAGSTIFVKYDGTYAA
jgi:hypothetical protein|tara:strand:- start:1258 stop:1833 length:576 start_codon:yes stop_codon:yes gene_type:complete